LHWWDVSESIERRQRLDRGELDVIPGMRAGRIVGAVLAAVMAACVVVALLAMAIG
jgi:hypothetical protein